MANIVAYEIKSIANTQKKYPLLRLEVADNFVSRFCGLMLRKDIGKTDGLLLSPCNSIHMCFMRFALDIVYLDAEGQVIRIVPHLRPWLGLSLCLKASAVIELPAGRAAELELTTNCMLRPHPSQSRPA